MIVEVEQSAWPVQALLAPERVRDAATERRVARIVGDVRRGGDAALLRYARTLDRLDGPFEIDAGRDARGGVRGSARRPVRDPHGRPQHPRRSRSGRCRVAGARQIASGVTVEQRVVPLDRVGCYVPGGRYPLPSSLLMTAIPAAAAGVREVIAVCPRPEPVVMAAALEAGVSRLFRLGGAHAIAALAYGTETVPRVDKIVGPGNRYVAAAKALVASDCGIDFYAGPTEIVIVAGRGSAAWIAADLIAQAEHDPDARAVLITPSRTLAARVARAVAARMPVDGPARQALNAHGGIIVTSSIREAMDLANAAAPEHLVVDDDKAASMVRSAGSLFVGPWSAQVAGDYAIGSNHVLPTAGAARVRGGLSGADFVRQITVQRVTPRGPAGDRAKRHRPGNRGGPSRPRRVDCDSVVETGQKAGPTAEQRSGVAPGPVGRPREVAYAHPGLSESRRRPPAAPEREHGRLLAAGARGHPWCQDRRRVDVSGVHRCRARMRASLRRRSRVGAADQRARRRHPDGGRRAHRPRALHDAETIVPLPAFDPYPNATAAVGATAVRVPPGPDYAFQTGAVLAAITPRTRMIFLNTPNNPTGQLIAIDDLKRISEAAPHAVVLIDEAYIEFGGTTFLPELPRYRNVLVGPHVLQGLWPGGHARRHRDRAAARHSIPFAR